jgi:hypothetical protein
MKNWAHGSVIAQISTISTSSSFQRRPRVHLRFLFLFFFLKNSPPSSFSFSLTCYLTICTEREPSMPTLARKMRKSKRSDEKLRTSQAKQTQKQRNESVDSAVPWAKIVPSNITHPKIVPSNITHPPYRFKILRVFSSIF